MENPYSYKKCQWRITARPRISTQAYANLTATQCTALNACNYSVHPVPGTEDGRPNPDFKRAIVALTPNGTEWPWQAPVFSDPLQGPAYHISKTKDAASGERWRRYEDFLAAVPVEGTVHSDACRDIDVSWETDERGFIAEDEEAICGLQADAAWWASKGLSSPTPLIIPSRFYTNM